jgi:hypothetical protein
MSSNLIFIMQSHGPIVADVTRVFCLLSKVQLENYTKNELYLVKRVENS